MNDILTTPNTSGQGRDAPVPRQIPRWNLGAFVFSSMWAYYNGLTSNRATIAEILQDPKYKSLDARLPLDYGHLGNELAWKYKRWSSVAEFLRIQRRWTLVGYILLTAMAILATAVLIAVVFSLVRHVT
jgi:hypothetical protein